MNKNLLEQTHENIFINSSTLVRYSLYPLIIITLCSAFQFYKYVLQVYPSIITDQLMNEFHLNGAGLGNLAATFYYAFIVTQFFVGILLDKLGARWVAGCAIFCCALGVFCFSYSHTALTAGLFRALIGVGVAFSTVTYMKLAAIWFPPRYYTFVGGLLATATMAGAVFGQLPLVVFMSHFGWRESLTLLGWGGFVLTLLFIGLVRNDKNAAVQDHESHHFAFRDIVDVLKSKQNWLLMLYGGLAFSPISIFGGLWGNPFLQQAYHLTKADAASMVSLIFLGLGIGSPIIGIIAEKIGNKLKVMFYSTLVSGVALSFVLFSYSMPIWMLGTFLFIFGFALGGYLLAFAIGKEFNKASVTATVIAMINAGDAILTGITEPTIGKLLDLTWDGKMMNGVHQFTLGGYHAALSTLAVYLAAAAFLLLLLKRDL